MNAAYGAVAVVAVVVFGAQPAADRRWQTGTWTQVGVKRTPFVGDVVQERMPSGLHKPRMTEVATYVIETDDRRYELQSLVAIGSDRFDLKVAVGSAVTFAVEKKTAYIRLDEDEHRLLVLKNERKRGT